MHFCPFCHNLDLGDPALKEKLPSESIEAGLYLNADGRRANFNIHAVNLQPDNPRLSQCSTCSLLGDALARLDPVLAATSKWEDAAISVYLEVGRNIRIAVITDQMPTRRYIELYVPGSVEYPFPTQGSPSDDLEAYPGSERLWRQLHEWMSTCQERHEDCRHDRSDFNPTRLVRVEQERQYLVISHESTQDAEPLTYAALSHCWGKEQPLRTLKHNLARHISDIEWDVLPRVFQDSIVAVRKLGISYLWIDSLCIVQDDPDDWARESQMMGRVYERAHVTVSATACESGTIPYLGPDAATGFRGWVECKSTSTSGPSGPLRARRIPSHLNVEGPVMGRAWMLQERFFSRRIIHFTELQTLWKCKEVEASESASGRSSLISSHTGNFRDPLHEWNDHLFGYAYMSLTKLSDKLPAIAGLAAHFKPQIGGEYVAGLWIGRPEQFAWQLRPGYLESRVLDEEAASKLAANRPPSWSWASITGSFCNWVTVATETFFTVDEIVCEPGTLNAFGEVKTGAFLRIRCLLAEASIVYQPGTVAGAGSYHMELEGRSDQSLACYVNCRLAVRSLGQERDDIWTGRAVAADRSLEDRPWTARIMIMPLVAREDDPPCFLLLGKQSDFEDSAFQRIGFADTLLPKDWNAVRAVMQAHDIILR